MIRTVAILDNGVASIEDVSVGLQDDAMTIESSAWPSVLSGGCEYGRIIADLFPEDASHCFAAVLPKYVEVTGWKPLTYSRLLDGFRGVKAVSSPPDHMSEEQLRDIAQGVCKTLGTRPRGAQQGASSGWGRVLLISSRLNRETASELGSVVSAEMDGWNSALDDAKGTSAEGSRIPIHHCELVCIAVTQTPSPDGEPEHVFRSPTVSVVKHKVNAEDVLPCVRGVVQIVMNLRQILVTGLEMKLPGGEKAMNDVSLLCAQPGDVPLALAAAQTDEQGAGAAAPPAAHNGHSLVLTKVSQIKQLKSKSGMLLPMTAAYRVTPVDVHSVATTCFIKFVLAGNDTCLAVEGRQATSNKKKDKALSRIQCTHILKEHFGALFLHSLDGSHTLMESLPTIERCAGSGIEMTEYRVQPTIDLLRKYTVSVTTPSSSFPKAKVMLDTEFFPLCRSQGIIFEYGEFEPLIRAVVSDSMDWHAFQTCEKLLAELQEKRTANDEYCFERVPRSHLVGIYNRVFEEIGFLTHAYRKVSPNHEKLTNVVAKMVALKEEEGSRATGSDKEHRAWDDLDKMAQMSNRELADSNSGDQNNAHFSKRRRVDSSQNFKTEHSSELSREIATFAADKSRAVLTLPRTLTSAERREAHVVAESFQLNHTSIGDGSERHLVITKAGHAAGTRSSSGGNSSAGVAGSLAGMKKASSTQKQDTKRFAGWN